MCSVECLRVRSILYISEGHKKKRTIQIYTQTSWRTNIHTIHIVCMLVLVGRTRTAYSKHGTHTNNPLMRLAIFDSVCSHTHAEPYFSANAKLFCCPHEIQQQLSDANVCERTAAAMAKKKKLVEKKKQATNGSNIYIHTNTIIYSITLLARTDERTSVPEKRAGDGSNNTNTHRIAAIERNERRQKREKCNDPSSC